MEAFKDAIMAYAVYYPVVEILSAIAIASIIWFGGVGVIKGIATLGVLVAFMQYAQRFFRPIQDLSEKYNILQSAMAQANGYSNCWIPQWMWYPCPAQKTTRTWPSRVRSVLVRIQKYSAS